MRVKLDENLPRALAELYRASGLDVATVSEEGLSGCADADLVHQAAGEGRLLITLDSGFADIRRYPPGFHSGIVVFRLKDRRWEVMRDPAQQLLRSGVLDRLYRGLAIVDERRVRVRRGDRGSRDRPASE